MKRRFIWQWGRKGATDKPPQLYYVDKGVQMDLDADLDWAMRDELHTGKCRVLTPDEIAAFAAAMREKA